MQVYNTQLLGKLQLPFYMYMSYVFAKNVILWNMSLNFDDIDEAFVFLCMSHDQRGCLFTPNSPTRTGSNSQFTLGDQASLVFSVRHGQHMDASVLPVTEKQMSMTICSNSSILHAIYLFLPLQRLGICIVSMDSLWAVCCYDYIFFILFVNITHIPVHVFRYSQFATCV